MRIPSELKKAALQAFRNEVSWSDFLRANAEAIRRAEPFNVLRYRRLTGRLLHLVMSGEKSGQFAISDPDAALEEPWLTDDHADKPDDTTTRAKFNPARAGFTNQS